MSEILAYKCEVHNPREGDWNTYLGESHPSEVFEELEYRNVTALVESNE